MIKLTYIFQRKQCKFKIAVLPTRSFGEHNEVRMLIWITFDELNTCEVLPVPHSLFEQRFVWTAETAIDLVRYYSEIPYPFFSGRGRSASPRTYQLSIKTNKSIHHYHHRRRRRSQM